MAAKQLMFYFLCLLIVAVSHYGYYAWFARPIQNSLSAFYFNNNCAYKKGNCASARNEYLSMTTASFLIYNALVAGSISLLNIALYSKEK